MTVEAASFLLIGFSVGLSTGFVLAYCRFAWL